MEYFNYLKAKAHITTASKSDQPVLTKEDEEFLNRIISDDQPPPLPVRSYKVHGGDAQVALMDGAQNIPLPRTPDEQISAVTEEPVAILAEPETIGGQRAKTKGKTWSWLRRDSREAKSRRDQTASDLYDLAQGVKPPDAKPNEDGQIGDDEARAEEEDMTIVLEKLNLAAINNRVFSISDETQDLLQKFNVILKDLVKGVPTAYTDLESLLTNGDRQLQNTYNSLPSFLQRLIEKLPETVTKGMGPEIMAAAAERATKAGISAENAGKAAGLASKVGRIPNLKELLTKPGAVVGMLKSIITFLRARFPAFMGMNVLWSLAMFVLLFVFWYCHKRGKETRLDKERDLTEREVERMEAEYKARHPHEVYTTTAPLGAPMHEVQAGVEEADAVRAARSAFQHTDTTASAGYVPSMAAHTNSTAGGA